MRFVPGWAQRLLLWGAVMVVLPATYLAGLAADTPAPPAARSIDTSTDSEYSFFIA